MGKKSPPHGSVVKKKPWNSNLFIAGRVYMPILLLGSFLNGGCTPQDGTFLSLSTVGDYPTPPSQETAKHDILEMENERRLLQGNSIGSPEVTEDPHLER